MAEHSATQATIVRWPDQYSVRSILWPIFLFLSYLPVPRLSRFSTACLSACPFLFLSLVHLLSPLVFDRIRCFSLCFHLFRALFAVCSRDWYGASAIFGIELREQSLRVVCFHGWLRWLYVVIVKRERFRVCMFEFFAERMIFASLW